MTSRLLVDKIEGKTTASTVQMPSGHIIQMQSSASTTKLNTNSSTFADVSGLSISFTNKFSNSKLIFICQNHVYVGTSGSSWNGGDFRILKDTTEIYSGPSGGYGVGHAGGSTSADRYMDYMMFTAEHSPSSTSTFTYKVQCATVKGSADNEINETNYGGGGRLIIMEIAQ